MYILNEDLFNNLNTDVSDIPNIETDTLLASEIEPKGPNSGLDNGIANMLHDLIINENESIQKYNNAVANLESRAEIIPIIQNIANDEMNHIGMLEVALGLLSPNTKNIEEGEVEGKEVLKDINEALLSEASKKNLNSRCTVAVDPVGLTPEDLDSGIKKPLWEDEKHDDTLEKAFQIVLANPDKDLNINWHWLSKQDHIDKITPIFIRIHSIDELVPDVVPNRTKREVFIGEYADNDYWRFGDTSNIESALRNNELVMQFAGYMRKVAPNAPRTKSNPQGGAAIGKNKELGEDMINEEIYEYDNEMKHMMVNFLANHHKPDEFTESLNLNEVHKCAKCGEEYPVTMMEDVDGEWVCGFCQDDSIDEDTEKKSNGKWVNKGDDGEHGEFKTKKEADAQRKAMFAKGFTESLDEAVEYWTPDVMKYVLSKNDEQVGKALVKLWELQTEDEKFSGSTYNLNGQGFNSLDANILSSFAKFYQEHNYLSPKQLEIARNKIMKYAKQLCSIANSEKGLVKPAKAKRNAVGQRISTTEDFEDYEDDYEECEDFEDCEDLNESLNISDDRKVLNTITKALVRALSGKVDEDDLDFAIDQVNEELHKASEGRKNSRR